MACSASVTESLGLAGKRMFASAIRNLLIPHPDFIANAIPKSDNLRESSQMISCRGLTKTFGDFRAVSGASFHIRAGSVCALLGPNGAGKSTVVKMLTGL